MGSRPDKATSQKHPKLAKLEKLIENFQNGMIYPSKTNKICIDYLYSKLFFFKGETDENEEDLVVESSGNQVSKCPITQKKIVDPFRNADCNHVYEREAIMSYLKKKK